MGYIEKRQKKEITSFVLFKSSNNLTMGKQTVRLFCKCFLRPPPRWCLDGVSCEKEWSFVTYSRWRWSSGLKWEYYKFPPSYTEMREVFQHSFWFGSKTGHDPQVESLIEIFGGRGSELPLAFGGNLASRQKSWHSERSQDGSIWIGPLTWGLWTVSLKS